MQAAYTPTTAAAYAHAFCAVCCVLYRCVWPVYACALCSVAFNAQPGGAAAAVLGDKHAVPLGVQDPKLGN